MPDFVYYAKDHPVNAAGTASLLHTNQAIWCPPPPLPIAQIPNNAGDTVWLVHGNDPNWQLLGRGTVLQAPQIHQPPTQLLWKDADYPGVLVAALGLGYPTAPGTDTCFLKLDHITVVQGPAYPTVAGVGLAWGHNTHSPQAVQGMATAITNALTH